MTPTWKTFLSRLHSTISGTGRRPVRTRRLKPLAIEQLEDRLVPSFALRFSTNGGATFGAAVTDGSINDTDPLAGTIGVNIGAISIKASSLGSTSAASTTLNLAVTGTAAASATVGHDIVVQASLDDLTTAPAPQTLVYSFTGSTPSGGTVTAQTWVDDGNTLFGTTGDTTGAKIIPASGSLVVSDTVPYSSTTQLRLVFKNSTPINLSLNNLNTITASPEQKAEIHGTKFEDVNGNGTREGGESGLLGWTIQLLDTNDNVLATTLTAVDGSYSFTNLTPGIYRVREVNQAGWTQITANPGDIGTVSGSNITGIDFGNFKNITIAGTKYTDITGDSFSSDDTPLAGITVNLFKNGALVATTTTASDGTYSFANQGPGNYFVQELVPTGYQQTGGNAGYTIVATSGLVSSSNNFDNFQLAKITGKKVNDITGDGITSDDTGLGGVTINLYQNNASGALVASTTTAADGTYSFDNLAPGTYFVQELVPAGYQQTAGNAGYTVTVGGTGVQSGGTATGNNFANFKQVTITGTKFTDITGDSFSSDDTPRAGVTINLYQNGSFVTSTVTGADGTYKFENLGPGNYFVQELVPAGATQTGGNAGYTIAATSGLNSADNNFDNFYHGQITGKKVTDLTGNGLSADDTGLGGVTVNLYKATSTLTLIASTVTAADGTYSFGDLDLGTYFVQELVPSGYVQTGGNAGYTITVGPGGVVSGGTSSGNDFANFQKGSITGTKYTDLTGNGLSGDDTGLGGVTINLYSGNSTAGTLVASTVTAANGAYSFGDLAPGTYFVQELVPAGATQTAGSAGYVVVIGQGGVGSGGTSSGNNFANFYRGQITGTKFTDKTGDGITSDDAGLGGITINLYQNNASGALIATTTTASDGTYSFGNLDLGTYFVQELVPAGSTQTAGIAGYTITVGPGGVTSGGTSAGNNFANFKNITIAGTKYTDITGNSFSSDDTPLAGITVNLFKNGALVATTTTASDGTYSFANQGPGNYFVQELVPTGYQQTGGNAGYTIVATSGLVSSSNNFDNFQLAKITGKKVNDITGDGITSDDTGLGGVTINLYQNNASGALVASTTTAADGTYSFDNLAPGTYFVQELVPAGYQQTAGNAGYTVTVGGTGVQSGGTATGNNFANFKKITISGTKYNDITGNSFSSDDTPLAGVTINLFKDGGTTPVATTVTASNGTYSFDNLAPGTYFVQELVPAGSVQTGGNAGYTIAATSGLNSTGNNFDNFKKVSVTGTKVTDKTGNGFTSDDAGLGGITINLYSGTSTAGTLVASTTTASNGTFSFSNLAPGTYFVQEVVPNGYVQTTGTSGYAVTVGGTGIQSGGTSANNNFANFQKVKITGTKFQDMDGCGFGSDDVVLGGVTVNLYSGTSTAGTLVATTVTAANGTFSFEGLAPGTYFVQEVVPAGWTQTGGNAGYVVTVGGTGVQSGGTASGKNFDNYKKPNPGIDIEKTTNGPTNSNTTAPDYDNEDAVDGPGVPILTPGSTVTWTYKVTNTGDVAFTTSQIAIVDDNGTPGLTSDDLSIANGKITFLSVQTGDSDNILEPGEVWLYKATGTVQDFSVPVAGSSVSFDFSGNSPVSGTAGNVRTFTSSGVSVNASAFSRDKTTGAWSTAYLGSYGGGLGVTDTSESGSSNSHTVDNYGRDNYVLFEFSESVVIDSAFLGYVVGDSDLTVWIGTKTGAFNNHLTLSDSVLASLGFTEVNLGGSSTRTANLNAALLAGNVLVIAAKTGDSDDNFKIETLCLQKVKPGVYENKATVTVPGDSDSDLSHYKNPPAAVGGSISGTKYLDVSGNGLNKTAGTYSPADTPLAGVTIYLDLDNDGRLDAGEPQTVTDANGNYLFTGLSSKTYYVREVVPAGFVRTGPALSDYYAVAVATGKSYTGYDFANAEACDTCVENTITCVSYTIYHTDGTRETVSDLRGRTREGDLITVTFKVNVPTGQTQQVTFVSYTAPGADFDANTASQQKIYDLDTDEFGPGTHTLTVRVPNCYYQVDFVCGFAIDKLGPANSNIFYTPQKRLLSADNGGDDCCDNAGTISGYKFNDADADGVWDNGEKGLSGWVVYLDGNNNGYKDSWETATVTDANGYYKFNNLAAGNYRVREVQQSGWVQSAAPALVALTTGQNKTGVNFGNVAGSLVSGCDTASIDFWNCSSGQNLIKSLNGGSTKTALGTWLANNFSKLYGSSSSYNLSGKTNAQVASYFQTLAGKTDKLEAQILATALAVYATDSDLAGGTYARNYGFKVTTTGIADEFYNIGTNGALFGVANGGVRTVWQILVAANNSATSGLAWNGNSTTRNAARTLFAGLNDVGGIG